jgi:tetratricopeptide (TPR) repeat protein/predicted Ser/Thr protein kinase
MPDPHDALKTPPVVFDLTGTNVGRFIVGARLGMGGMGLVYRAEDTTLKRVVAIKRLAPQSQFDERDRDRFLREAQRASALNHPNVAAIYDVLQHRGEILLVMEYVEGFTLRQRMTQPILIEEFLEIAAQCAEGLGAAHEKRILHGDIKPENIMLTASRRVKILDFGVAKRFSIGIATEATESLNSVDASINGTPAYMAPEVLMQKPYDGRADIFSLGLVFYEVLSGKQPFLTESFAGTVGLVLHAEPLTVHEMNPRVPPSLSVIVGKMMIKDPTLRYPNVQAVANHLRILQQGGTFQSTTKAEKSKHRPRVSLRGVTLLTLAVLMAGYALFHHYLGSAKQGNAAVLPAKQILAVLPFHPLESNSKLTALGRGLVESVAAKLAGLAEDRSLEVIPARNMQEKSATSLEDARRLFGANLGLAVTLEQSGNLMRVSYSMLDAKSGGTIGSDSITVPANDVFAVEDDVADGASRALQWKLRPGEQGSLRIHGTSQPAAYNNYLQARGYLLDYTKSENVDNAIIMVRQALKQDPNFGMARAALGEAYWRKYLLTKAKSWTSQARKECREAVELGNAGASGHMCLGLVDDGTGRYKEAETEYQRAVELEPTNENAYIGLALAFEHQGAADGAEKTYQRAIETHPQSWVSHNAMGTFYYRQGEYDNAVLMFRKVTQLAPEDFAGYVNLGATYNNTGRYAEAIEPLTKSIALRPVYAAFSNLGTAYFGLLEYAEAAKAYEKAIKVDPEQYVSWGNLGIVRYYAGDKGEAAVPFHKAVELASQELKVNPRNAEVLGDLASYYAMLGERDRALMALEKSLQSEHNDKDLIFNAADVYNQLGETGLALEWLAKAVHAGYSVEKFRNTPNFRNLVGNPQYDELIRKGSLTG